MPRLPGPLRLPPSFPFAGRSRELAALRALIPRADGDGARLVLVGGEAGSGKSRLVREFAQEAAEGGALVLYGACDAVVRRPYRPFVEALDQLVRATDADALRADLGRAAGSSRGSSPTWRCASADLPPPVAGDPDTERHRLHSAVADLLAAASRRTPIVLVVEDGHWADTPTLLLLRHLARGIGDARAVLVTTFRDTEADVPEALSSALADLRRSEGVVRLRLGGLSAAEVAEFVVRAAGEDLGPELADLARSLRELTGGNAFLVTELWRTLLELETAVLPGEAPGSPARWRASAARRVCARWSASGSRG